MKSFFERYPSLWIIVFTVCWLGMDTLFAGTGVSVYEVVWARYGVYLTCIAIIFGPSRGMQLFRSQRMGLQFFGSLFMLGMPVFFVWSFQHLTPNNALSLFWFIPLIVLALSLFRKRERADAWTWIATIVGLVGALCLCRPDAGVLSIYALLPLGSALCFALYLMAMRALPEDSVLSKLFHTGLWVFVAFTIGIPLFWKTPTLTGAMCLILIGFLEWGTLYAAIMGLKNESPARLAPVLYAKLVWDSLRQWHMQEGTYDLRFAIGLALVIAAVSVALFRRGRALAPATDTPGYSDSSSSTSLAYSSK